MKSVDKMRSLLESNDADIKYAKKKSIEILGDIEDRLGSAKALISGLEGYIESLELFYNEMNNKKASDKTHEILSLTDKLRIKLDVLRSSGGTIREIQRDIKKLK